MAIRNNVLFCVYKLGGVVHEVETGQITTTTNVNSSDFDRVVFHRSSLHMNIFHISIGTTLTVFLLSVCLCVNCRVYQDAEVNITQNFTSQKPVSFSPNRNLPNTMTGVLNLHPDSVVLYVGGYPEDFTVTSHCHCFIIPACILFLH